MLSSSKLNYYFIVILFCCWTGLFSSYINRGVFAQPTDATAAADSAPTKPGCGGWEKTAKDEIARFKEMAIENADKEEKLELRCVNKVNKIRAEQSKKIQDLKNEVTELKASSTITLKELEKWKKRATRAENVLRTHVANSETKRKEISSQKANLEDEVEALKKRVTGWHAAATLVAKWAKEEHEDRHKWLKKHADELGQLSSLLKKEQVKFSESYLDFIKKGFTRPEDFVKSIKSLYSDAKNKRTKREKILSKHKEKEFQESLKILESEAPAGYLRGQGSLVSSPASSNQDPATLFGLQSTSNSNSGISYNSLPGSSLDKLGGGGVNQWI